MIGYDEKILENIWPEWKIEKELGSGSYGKVYKAVRRDYNVESYAAVKVISVPSNTSEIDSLRSDGLDINGTRTYLQSIVNDFVGEIQLMESLKGMQNIVSIEDYKVVEKTDEIGWNIYIRMELLTPFNIYICDKDLSEEEVIKIGCEICTALEICSQRNIIHRDIKPENIFVNDFGYFKLGDFGVARKLENMTGGLSQKGAFNYMAPEVTNSINYDARVDIYSLGIVLYRLLNENRLPFLDTEKQLLNPNERRFAIERRFRGDDLPAPCNASPEMADLILRACAFDPADRFSSATEMKQALISVQNGTYQCRPKLKPEPDPLPIPESDHDATIAVRRSTDEADKTISVRQIPEYNREEEEVLPKAVHAEKSIAPKVVIPLIAIAIAAGIGIYHLNSADKSADAPDNESNIVTEGSSDASVHGDGSIGTSVPYDNSKVPDTAKETAESPTEADEQEKDKIEYYSNGAEKFRKNPQPDGSYTIERLEPNGRCMLLENYSDSDELLGVTYYGNYAADLIHSDNDAKYSDLTSEITDNGYIVKDSRDKFEFDSEGRLVESSKMGRDKKTYEYLSDTKIKVNFNSKPSMSSNQYDYFISEYLDSGDIKATYYYNGEPVAYVTAEFENGQAVKKSFYNADNTLIGYFQYEYAVDKLSKKNIYFDDLLFRSEEHYNDGSYDYVAYTKNGGIRRRSHVEIKENGFMETDYDEDGNIISERTTEYSGNRTVITSSDIIYNPDGTTETSTSKWVDKYDEEGNYLGFIDYDINGNITMESFIEHLDDGTEKTTTKNYDGDSVDTSYRITERISYNQTKSTRYYENGSISGYSISTYSNKELAGYSVDNTYEYFDADGILSITGETDVWINIKYIYYGLNGTVIGKNFFYDDGSREYYYYNDRGALTSHTKYDSKGNQIN